MSQIIDVVAVQPLEDFHLHLIFEDGASGIVDIKPLTRFSGVFQPLLEPDYFQQVGVNPELGTVYWNSGADFDPIVLYALATGKPIPDLSQTTPMQS